MVNDIPFPISISICESNVNPVCHFLLFSYPVRQLALEHLHRKSTMAAPLKSTLDTVQALDTLDISKFSNPESAPKNLENMCNSAIIF